MEDTREKLPMERVNGIALELLDRLDQAVRELDAVVAKRREKSKTEDVETVLEYEQRVPRKKGIVDRGGLKQLTGVLKDLEDILLCLPELDAREQLARISRLEREMDQQSHPPEILVTLEGEAKDFAD